MTNSKGTRRFFALYSYMGTNFTYDSPCWALRAYTSKAKRDVACEDWEHYEKISAKKARTNKWLCNYTQVTEGDRKAIIDYITVA